MKIGVLGGIGPEATGLFYNKLIKKFQESGLIKNNTDFPQIIINSIPAPELIYEKINENDLLPYIKGLKELELLNVDYIVMVCNTIHLYYDELQREVKVPIIDLKSEIRNNLKEKNSESMLVLGTPSTLKRSLYAFDKIKYYILNETEVAQISDAIFNYNRGDNKLKQKEIVLNICFKYLKQGAKNILLGCTELSVMLENEKIPKIDTLEIMINAAFKNASKQN